MREWDTHELILQVAHRHAQTHSQMQADWQADRHERTDVRTQAHVHVYISVQSDCKSDTFTDREGRQRHVMCMDSCLDVIHTQACVVLCKRHVHESEA